MWLGEYIMLDKVDDNTQSAVVVADSSGGALNEEDEDETVSVDKLFHDEFDSAYLQKSKILSDAIDEIGMGKYQWLLFIVCGFGWMADNLWPIVTSLILPQITLEFLSPENSSNGPYITLAQNLGLLAGAVFWSNLSDIYGRRIAFNLTFLVTGVWGVVSGSSPTFAALGVFTALYSFGVGGNIIVDSATLIEAIPHTHQYLLTIESVWWALGQLITNAIAFGYMKNFACSQDQAGNCKKEDNMGWRYLFFTMGAISLLMFSGRFFFFRLFESPKFLLARGREEQAVEVVHKIAQRNGKISSLTIEHLREVDATIPADERKKPPTSKFTLTHFRELFGTKKIAFSTSIIVLVWAIIGVAFPLYNAFLPTFLQNRSGDAGSDNTTTSYRNSLIISCLGIPGSLIAGLLVELRIGRKGTLCISSLLTGVFLFGSTTAKTSNQLLGWNCGFNFASNIMYGVLYAGTAESFPARVRGTGVGLASSANRVLGVFAPIIGMYADLTTAVPIYVSGALFLVAGLLVLVLPYEPRGKASL